MTNTPMEEAGHAAPKVAALRLPVEQWEDVAATYSGLALAGAKPGTLVSVRPLRVRGRPALVVSVSWGALPERCIEGYFLTPEADYPGPTTQVWYDKGAIERGERKRGDHTGLLVSWRGQRLVCDERFKLAADLPMCRLPLSDAVQADTAMQVGGWRALAAVRRAPEGWWWFDGHPVVGYLFRDGVRYFLFYRTQMGVQEALLSRGPLAGILPIPEDEVAQAVALGVPTNRSADAMPAPQGSLF